ncbi:MAG: serine protease [Verrucomicrobiota bacterium]|jgi:hypothetical protein|nr:serine protease [Verrucomicrobiota bacterium]
MKSLITLSMLCVWGAAAVRAEPAAERLMNATFKIFNPDSTATGFLVRDPAPDAPRTNVVLVTANHVFSKAKGDHVLLVCRVRDEAGGWRRLDHKVPIRDGTNALWTCHPSQDVAVIRCRLPPQAVFDALPAEAVADEKAAVASGLSIGDALFYCSYPHRIEADAAGFPLLRTGAVSGYPLFPVSGHPTVFFSGATFAGDSGAPVAVAAPGGEPPLRVVGLIVLRTQHNDHLKSDEWDLTFKRDIGLGSFVHAAYIAECLDALAR